MNDNIDWRNIRIINHTQQDGFEELVCQIARKEKENHYKRFVQLGLKDGGLECYWELTDDTIIGWQAKYFTDSFTDTQWRQIRESVKNASETYGVRLTTMIIAIPYKTSHDMQEKADEKIEKWKDEFENCPEIKFWWEGDLNNFLSKESYSGFRKFWFNKLEFTDDWFEEKTSTSINNLGDRYNHKINIDTNSQIYFDSIYRNDEFKKYIYEKTEPLIIDFRTQYNNIIKLLDKPDLKIELKKYLERVDEITNILLLFKFENDFKIEFDGINSFSLEKISELLDEIEKNIIHIKSVIPNGPNNKKIINELYGILSDVNKFKDFISNNKILNITNNPTILFYGEAGIGKSFLFGTIADQGINNNKNTLLLLGEQFETKHNPENIILDLLGIKGYTFDEFLDALESKAYVNKSRIIILIDAINEGSGVKFWNKYLKGFINKVSNRNMLSFVFSIRDTFLNKNNENELNKLQIKSLNNLLTKIELTGFKDDYDARIEYFKKYKIKFPNNYMLSPELNNPLFLNIFCETIKNLHLENDLDNMEGFSKIIELYIYSINQKLSEKFSYHPHINLVSIVLNRLIEFESENEYIEIEKANNIVMECLSDYPFKHEFLNELINERIIKESIFLDKIHLSITFQRFEDYVSTKYLLENTDFDTFIKNLNEIVESKSNINILEMLSIYVPENYGIELYCLLNKHLKSEFDVMNSFIQSLKWRKYSVDENVFEYINEYILKDYDMRPIFLETLISLSSIENHLFNSYRTHEMLKRLTLSERDGFWTIFLHDQNYENSEVNNLLNFAFMENHEYYSDESLRLASIMITWFLSTTNRKLRDKSTYALVNLLKNKLYILKELLQLFEDVDDPYVLERLYAAAYGCVLNSRDYENLEDLSNYIYESIFNQELVYPHILIRDYARNIIEFSLNKDCIFNDEIVIVKEKITPPYSSEFPKIPSDEEIEKYKTGNNAVKRIFSSMCVEYDRDGKSLLYGYFGRYTFQFYFTLWEKVLRENNIHFIDLMNIALDKIFKLDYNEEIHGYFDEYVVGLYEHEEFTERIGEKYQWIALYELLARVSDKFPTIYDDYISNEKDIPYQGPWQDSIRNIDPTITCNKNLPKLNWDFEEKYSQKNFLKDCWMDNIQDLPDFSKIIESNIKMGKTLLSGLILEGYLTWIKHRGFGQEEYPKKEIWCQIRSYIVKNNEFNNIVPFLKHKNFDGRWMPESHENYELFNKEFYRSIAFDYFYDNGWNETYELNLNNNKYDVNVTTSKYSGSERSELINKNYLKINKTLFESLNLRYGEENSFLYDENNNLVGFDISEFNNIHNTAFIFDKGILLHYLKENNLNIFFTVLGEKMIINRGGIDSKIQTFSGVYSFNDNGLKGYIKPYSKCYFEELKTFIAGIVKEVKIEMNNTFKKRLYVDYNNKICYLFIETKIIEFIAKKEFITNEVIKNYEWNIYSLDKNKIGKKYLKFISGYIGEIGDSYLIQCKFKEKYYTIIIGSTFEESNSNMSKLYQQFIKPLLLNMEISLKRDHYFGNDVKHQSCMLFVPEDYEDKINEILSLVKNNKEKL